MREVIAEAQVADVALAETIGSGKSKVEDRIGWAITHIDRAGWISRPQRGHYRIEDSGSRWLREHPEGLASYREAERTFAADWVQATSTATAMPLSSSAGEDSPSGQIEAAVKQAESLVADDLLERLRGSDPAFFEQAVIQVLLKMGYGGAEQRGRRIGGTGDGGVDGVIDQDALGLDQVYVQAKRYADGNTVGSSTLQAFVGALHGVGATRGVFITSSAFTAQARDFVDGLRDRRVILIDGNRLAALMIQYQVGVQVAQTYTVVEVDEDFFE